VNADILSPPAPDSPTEKFVEADALRAFTVALAEIVVAPAALPEAVTVALAVPVPSVSTAPVDGDSVATRRIEGEGDDLVCQWLAAPREDCLRLRRLSGGQLRDGRTAAVEKDNGDLRSDVRRAVAGRAPSRRLVPAGSQDQRTGKREGGGRVPWHPRDAGANKISDIKHWHWLPIGAALRHLVQKADHLPDTWLVTTRGVMKISSSFLSLVLLVVLNR